MPLPDTRLEHNYEVWSVDSFGTVTTLVKGNLTLNEAQALAKADRYNRVVHLRRAFRVLLDDEEVSSA